MTNHSAVIVQEPDDDFPAQVEINMLDYDFASVFKTLFPDIQCPHCVAQMRLLFIAGVLSSDKAYEGLDQIRDEKVMDEASKWFQTQVEEGRTELDVELKLAHAQHEGHYHKDESNRHH